MTDARPVLYFCKIGEVTLSVKREPHIGSPLSVVLRDASGSLEIVGADADTIARELLVSLVDGGNLERVDAAVKAAKARALESKR